MRKSAEKALNQEIRRIITASDYKIVKESLGKLINLSDILDSIGDEKDADRVDAIIKEAGSWWEDLLSGGAVGAGSTIWNALKGGGGFDKKTLVTILKKALEGSAINLMSNAILEQIAKIPYLGWLVHNETVRGLISSGLTFAIVNSDFVDKFVDHLIDGLEQYFGMKPDAKPAQQQSVSPVQQPAQEDSNAQSFQVAAPGTKV